MKDAVSHLIHVPYTTLKSSVYGIRKTTKPRDSTRNDFYIHHMKKKCFEHSPVKYKIQTDNYSVYRCCLFM